MRDTKISNSLVGNFFENSLKIQNLADFPRKLVVGVKEILRPNKLGEKDPLSEFSKRINRGLSLGVSPNTLIVSLSDSAPV